MTRFCRLLIVLNLLFAGVCLGQISDPESASYQYIPLRQRFISLVDTIPYGNDTLIITKNLFIRNKDTIVTLQKRLGKHQPIFKYDSLVTTVDTVITLEDTLFRRGQKVLKDIETFSKKRNIISRLLRPLVVFNHDPPPTTIQTPAQTINRYAAYEGKVIGDIKIVVLDAFGESIEDPSKQPRSLLEKSGNFIHVKSHNWVIRNKLVFKSGEKIDGTKLAESERLLRQSNHLYDATISVIDTTLYEDTLDVLVLVQDVWNISVGAGLDPGSQVGDVNLRDVNFLGLGHQVDNSLKLDQRLPEGHNYKGSYFVNNIYKTFSTANLYYNFVNGLERYGGGINREFLTPGITVGGGVNYNWNSVWNTPFKVDTSERIIYRQQEYWVGYAASKPDAEEYKGNRFLLAGRLIRTLYDVRPVRHNPNGYSNSDFYLGSVGYFNRKFYKDNYIFRLGRTEDVPEGHLFSFTYGYLDAGNNSRNYYGLNATYCKFINHVGYLYGTAGIGAFRFKDTWLEGVKFARFLYYTPLLTLGKWKWRTFISTRYTEGINNSGFITLNRESGFRGLNADLLAGKSKFVVNVELDFFPYFNLAGFKLGFLAFADFGWVANRNKLFGKDNFFPGYGIGLRIKNEHLVFNMFQILLTYYPTAYRLDESTLQLFERTKYFYNFTDIDYSRPTTIPFF